MLERAKVVAREGTLKSCSWSGVPYASDARVEHFPGVVVAFDMVIAQSRDRSFSATTDSCKIQLSYGVLT
jgi:hypothetical protein